MANTSSLSRGSLKKKIETGFAQAELFWEPRTTDIDNKSPDFDKWNEGTLWIGRPSLDGSPSAELPIPIAGGRTHNALVYRGTLSTEASILDDIFEHARVGDWYVFTADAVAGTSTTKEYTFHKTDDFRKDDVLIIVDVGGRTNIDIDTGKIIDQSLIKYYRLNNSGGYADDVYFRESVTKNFYQWQADNVEGALKEVQIEKLQFIKTIGSAADIPATPIVGGLYLITADDIEFNTARGDHVFTCDKGDFVYWTADTLYEDDSVEYKTYNTDYYWHLIPSGYTNADEIDYYDADRINNGQKDLFIKSLFGTFSDYHKDLFNKNSDNVHKMLDFLMGNKAQLDEQGKVPLSQLHDTVLGALQFKGNFCPLNGTITEDMMSIEEGTNLVTITVKDRYNPLPGYSYYADGDTLDTSDEASVQNGDYYIIDLSAYGITNLQYDTGDGIWELNTGDWIVFSASDNQDSTSSGSSSQKGRWTKIDNSDRLTQMSYTIDRIYDDNFWTTVIDEKQLNLVGNPILRASHKVGLVNKGHNTVEIVGDHLVDQLLNEHSISAYHPRYVNEDGTIQNSFLEDILTDYATGDMTYDYTQFHKAQSNNKSLFHSNVVIGVENSEHRDLTTYGDIHVLPHLKLDEDSNTQVNEKSLVHFRVFENGTKKEVYLFAQDGSKVDDHGIDEDMSDELVNIALPEHTSTLVGKLSGVQFEEGRLLKSVDEGYAESTSIEEHINESENTMNSHDGVKNIVEFHSQVSTPINNTYEIWFGTHDSTNNKDYDSSDFKDDGQLYSALLARLTKNFYQEEANIYVSLPCESGTLLTQENLIKIFGDGVEGDTYLTMFGDTSAIDGGPNRFNTFQKAPIRQVENALRTRILSSLANADTAKTIRAANAEEFAKIKRATTDPKYTEKFTPTTDTSVSDTVIENDVVVGKYDDEGNLLEKKSLVATKALGVGDDEHAAGFIRAPRTNFPTAEQYYNPWTGEYYEPQDVQVDMPNESGVMLTNNSLIDGGLYL